MEPWLLAERRISIHVPREGDDHSDTPLSETSRISIHVPREGDDSMRKNKTSTS